MTEIGGKLIIDYCLLTVCQLMMLSNQHPLDSHTDGLRSVCSAFYILEN